MMKFNDDLTYYNGRGAEQDSDDAKIRAENQMTAEIMKVMEYLDE